MSKAIQDIEGFSDEDIWSSSPSGMIDAAERVWQFRWVLAVQIAVIAGGFAWISEKPSTALSAGGAEASSEAEAQPLEPSNMRWLSDLGSIGSSYEMMKDTPDIALAMQDVVAANAKIDQVTPPEVAISRAATQIGYVPKVSRGSDLDSTTSRILLGAPEILSGDTMKIDGNIIRLANAKAPSSEDSCTTASGKSYDCGAWAKQGLALMVKDAQVSCRVGAVSGAAVQTGRCEILGAGFRGDRDVAGIGVASGMLLATRGPLDQSPYAALEQGAKSAHLGLWSGDFTPADMRKTTGK